MRQRGVPHPGRVDTVTEPPAPNPQPFRQLTLDEVLSWREIDCASYQGCLNVALREGWAGFHCKSCRAYKRLPPRELMREMGCLLALAHVAGVEPVNDNERRKPR